MTVSKFSVLFLGFISGAALAQQTSQTADDLAKQTALLKAQQAYYDQLLATAKSQQAAADASLATQLATLSTANQLQVAQYINDLALATAVKGSGLTAAVGKDGTITTASADKTLLAFQQGSLKAVETLSSTVCGELQQKSISAAFVVPPNYELLVQKSVVDVMQLYALHDAAVTGIKAYGTVKMEVAGLALAGAMVTAQYLAGGIQSLSKLFRTDYNVSFTPINRQGLFEQMLSASCPQAVMNNVESRLRLNAAKILMAWIPDMAKFVQLNDAWSEWNSPGSPDTTLSPHEYVQTPWG